MNGKMKIARRSCLQQMCRSSLTQILEIKPTALSHKRQRTQSLFPSEPKGALFQWLGNKAICLGRFLKRGLQKSKSSLNTIQPEFPIVLKNRTCTHREVLGLRQCFPFLCLVFKIFQTLIFKKGFIEVLLSYNKLNIFKG